MPTATRCNLCNTPVDVQSVTTDFGTIDVYQCLVCDRSKCGNCNRPVPGRAKRCPYCRASVWWPPKVTR